MAAATQTPIPMKPILATSIGCLKEKAKEDAEFQKQIADYAAKGIIASVVEDEAAKWAVWAKVQRQGTPELLQLLCAPQTGGE